MQFTDVVCTHSSIEKGKDFIAKDKNKNEQWVFQIKKGNLSVSDLNNGITGQLLSAAITNHAHPAFDSNLPRKVVLVTTGKVNQHAADNIASLSSGKLAQLEIAPIQVWDSQKLVELFTQFGLEGIRSTRFSQLDFHSQGSFYNLYGDLLVGRHSLQAISAHAELWIDQEIPSDEALLRCSLEASILSSICRERGYLYERLFLELGVFRTNAYYALLESENVLPSNLETRMVIQLESVVSAAETFILTEVSKWEQASYNLLASLHTTSSYVTYRIQASRIIEALGLLVFCDLRPDNHRWSSLLTKFIENEPGACEPVSDNFAASISVAGTALISLREIKIVTKLIKSATVWLADRVEFGSGLAGLDSSAYEETARLLGTPFSGLKLTNSVSSLLATVLLELSAALGDEKLYQTVLNDIKAVKIIPEYFQAQDNISQVLRTHPDLRHYVGIEFKESIEDENYSPYARYEAETNRLKTALGFKALVCLTLFLRDRVFCAQWPKLDK
jgi:hypothetical protein